MNGLRKPLTFGLVLIMCALTGHCGQSATSVAPVSAAAGRGAHKSSRKIVEIMRRMEERHSRHGAKTEAPTTAQAHTSSAVPKKLPSLKKTKPGVPHKMDNKVLQHFTGPLYFSRDCKTQANRLYSTRECTIPAFFMRCARLLTRLSERQECKVG